MTQSKSKAANVPLQSWDQLYQDKYPQMVKLAGRRLPIEERYNDEDFVQDAYLRLLQRHPDPGDLTDPKNFYFRTLQNLIYDRAKSRSRLRREKVVSLDALRSEEEKGMAYELADPGRGPEMDAEIKIDNEKYRRTLASLSEDLTDREKALLALYLEGYTSEEIASMWGEGVKVIRVDKNSMLAKIRYRAQHGHGNWGGTSQS